MNQTKNVFIIQTMSSLIGGILSVALPLLMIDRGIDIVTLGFIFAALPIIFQCSRMIFGAISDLVGRKLFFVSNGILNVLMLIIYYFALSPLGFLFGKVIEGVKSASLWSVNRALILDHDKRKRESLANMMGVAHISRAAGSIMAGFLILWLFYNNTLIFCMFISILIIPIALRLKKGRKRKFSIKDTFNILDFRKKSKIFKRFLLLFFITGLSGGLINGYVLPLFLKENMFSVEMIGIIFGIYIFLIGLSSIFTKKIDIKKLVLYGGVLYCVLLFLLGLFSYVLAALFLLLFGVTAGIKYGAFEGILAKITHVNSYASDIGMLTMGLHIGNTTSLVLSGFLIEYYGFFALFSLSAIIYMIYFLLTYHTLKIIK